MTKNKLKMSSATYTPSICPLDGSYTVGELSEALLAALPLEAIEISKSRKPQQPIVFITGLEDYFCPSVAKLFLEYDSGDEGQCLRMGDLISLGKQIHEHIQGAWPIGIPVISGEFHTGDVAVDRRGRPTAWDKDFIPSNLVLAFHAHTAQDAYMRVVSAIAMTGEEELSDTVCRMFKDEFEGQELEDFEKWVKNKDESDDEFNYTSIDHDCQILFLHFESSKHEKADIAAVNMSVGIVKMRDVIRDAIEFSTI
jgi:hypothetical protein